MLNNQLNIQNKKMFRMNLLIYKMKFAMHNIAPENIFYKLQLYPMPIKNIHEVLQRVHDEVLRNPMPIESIHEVLQRVHDEVLQRVHDEALQRVDDEYPSINDIQMITLIVAINIEENGAIIKNEIEMLIDENEDLFFILYNFQDNYIGNNIQTVDKVNHGRLKTEKTQEFIIEKKYKNYLNLNSLLIKTITDNLVLNLNNLKYLENTKNLLHVDCDGIQKRKQKHFNTILTSKSIVNKKMDRSLIFSIISLLNQSKMFLNDIYIILFTNKIPNSFLKPTNALDFINFLKLQSITMKPDKFNELNKYKNDVF